MAEFRQAAGLTQSELAERAGVKRDYLSSVEVGRIGLMYPLPTNAVKRELNVPGWVLLEAMGYETDANDDRIIPTLLTSLRRLNGEQQRALLWFVQSMWTSKEEPRDGSKGQ